MGRAQPHPPCGIVAEAATSTLWRPARPLDFRAQDRLRRVRAPAVGTFGHAVGARLALGHRATLDRALLFVGAMFPCPQRAASISGALRSNVAIVRAACSLDPGIIDLEANQAWKRVKAHAVPVARYVGKGTFGTEKLREELEAGNEGVKISFLTRWLGQPSKAKARFKEGTIVASSVTSAVAGETVFNRLCKCGLRLLGRRHDFEVFEEIRPDVRCGR